MWLSLNYDLLKKWRPIVFTTLGIEIVYQAIIYLHPENLDWVGSEHFSLLNTLQFIFIDQFLIECASVAIIFQLIRWYGTKLKLLDLKLNAKDIALYELKFLPILLVSFFVFAPVTLTLRFLYHYLPGLNWDIYFSEYFYSVTLYFNYLTPVFLVGYIIINVNLIYQYNLQLGETKSDLHKVKRSQTKNRLWASDDFGELFLETDKIQWIVREERKTFAITESDKYRLKENITELEEKLDSSTFIRINRSTIVNLSSVLNYSFWENDKYILRMKNSDTEFVMSRDRLHKIKHQLLPEEVDQ
ncbi:LytTR family DNA-binding domain-containing protein [Ekhidna sp. To15]|uniref:LytTR family DNA-binding domain-containing protein n=1 Tax=Ekhidna sp. To15 TaxID=3395267 RepID=UPI003F51C02E